jgi:hypothetical protein
MAGTGPIQDAIGPLIHLFDWSQQHDNDTRRITATSPDRTTTMDFDPGERFGKWWTVTHHGKQDWRAAFTRQTPAEAIAAVTQSLPQLLGDHRHIAPLDTADDPIVVAGYSGWQQPGSDPGLRVSPDGHCTLRHTPGAETAWWVETSVYEGFDTQWDASFSAHVPLALVTRFVTHLTAPDPVQRRYGDIPALARPFALITPAHQPLGNAHLTHALGQLDRALPKPPPGTEPHRHR